MKRSLAPIRAHEGLARGALVVALVCGGWLAATADVGPPDYHLPDAWLSGAVQELTDLPTDGGSGGRSLTSYATTDFETGDELRVEYAWSDDGPRLTPDAHTVVADRLHRCVRIVVSTTGFDLDPAALDDFVATHAAHVDRYLDEAPRDPCAGRPLTP